MKKDVFEKQWGFSFEEVIDGVVGFSYEDWFKDLEKTISNILQGESFKNDTEEEKAKFVCLSYMACVSLAKQNVGRDMAEKTYPHFQIAVLQLQKDFEAHGYMLEALHKRYLRKALSLGKSNVEAVKEGAKEFRSLFEKSFVKKAAAVADVEIEFK